MRKTNQAGIELIKRYEGLRLKPYLCAAGYPTIGYGHLVASLRVPAITAEEAERLLKIDLFVAESAVLRLVRVPLTDGQFDALVSFVFNLGSGRLQASTLLRRLNAGDYQGAALEFRKWVYGGGRKLPGLIARREAEAALFLASAVVVALPTKRSASVSPPVLQGRSTILRRMGRRAA